MVKRIGTRQAENRKILCVELMCLARFWMPSHPRLHLSYLSQPRWHFPSSVYRKSSFHSSYEMALSNPDSRHPNPGQV